MGFLVIWRTEVDNFAKIFRIHIMELCFVFPLSPFSFCYFSYPSFYILLLLRLLLHTPPSTPPSTPPFTPPSASTPSLPRAASTLPAIFYSQSHSSIFFSLFPRLHRIMRLATKYQLENNQRQASNVKPKRKSVRRILYRCMESLQYLFFPLTPFSLLSIYLFLHFFFLSSLFATYSFAFKSLTPKWFWSLKL